MISPNFHIRQLGEITVFLAVNVLNLAKSKEGYHIYHRHYNIIGYTDYVLR